MDERIISAALAEEIEATLALRQTQQRNRLAAIGANYVPALHRAGQGELGDRLQAVVDDLIGIPGGKLGNIAILRNEILGMIDEAEWVFPEPEPEPETPTYDVVLEPGESFQQVLARVPVGGIVGVPEGQWPSQTLVGTCNAAVFRALGPVNLGGLNLCRARDVRIEGVTIPGRVMLGDEGVGAFCDHVELYRVKAAGWWADSVEDVLIDECDFTGVRGYNPFRGATRRVRRVVVRKTDIHGAYATTWDDHCDGMWVSGVDDLQILDSRFYRNAHFNFAHRGFPNAYVNRMVIDGCRFATCWTGPPSSTLGSGWYSAQFHYNGRLPTDSVVRNSVFGQAVDRQAGGPAWENNVIDSSDPSAGIPEALAA